MTMREEERKREYREMTAEELERRLRETFFCPDRIDDAVLLELEELLKALEEKRPPEEEPDPEEAWQRFLENNAEIFASPAEGAAAPMGETGGERLPDERPRSGRRGVFAGRFLRRVIIAAVIAVLAAGAALAAGSLGLWAWVPGWNALAGRYEPVRREPGEWSTVPAALAELGITEPLYPARLPEGFVITESHVSEDPLILMEQYARGSERFSLTITPTSGFRTAVFQKEGDPVREYRSGSQIHYVFAADGSITAIRYTKNYAAAVSGNLSLTEMKGIIDSLYGVSP